MFKKFTKFSCFFVLIAIFIVPVQVYAQHNQSGVILDNGEVIYPCYNPDAGRIDYGLQSPLHKADPQFIIVNPYRYEYDITKSNPVYFPSRCLEAIQNKTQNVMRVSDTFETNKQKLITVGLLGSATSAEAELKAKFNFTYNFEDSFSRNITVSINPGYTLEVYTLYDVFTITEYKYGPTTGGGVVVARFNDSPTGITYRLLEVKTQTIYKPIGITYKTVK